MGQKTVPAMKNRKDFLKRLYESDKYKQALSRARNDEERRAVVGLLTEFVGNFADVLGPIIDRAQKDPAFAYKLGQAVVERQQVVTDNEPAVTGSME